MQIYGLILGLVLLSGIANGTESRIPGAKELFYDPAGDHLTTGSPLPSGKPSAGKDGKSYGLHL